MNDYSLGENLATCQGNGRAGTRFPTLFASGRLNYWCFVLRKAAAATPFGDLLHQTDRAMPALA